MDALDDLLIVSTILFLIMLFWIWKVKSLFSSENSEPEGVMICPRCGGKDIKSRGVFAHGLSPNYICTNCGYQAAYFPTIKPEEAEKIKSKPQKIDIFHQPIWNDHSKMTEKKEKGKMAEPKID